LLVAGRIGDNEFPLAGRKKPVRDIDGDRLFAFRHQAVDQQRIVEPLALRADPGAVGAKRGQLILGHAPALVEQAADQRRFSVIDATAGHEAQQTAGLRRVDTSIRCQSGVAH
jgi:hypothetical protein